MSAQSETAQKAHGISLSGMKTLATGLLVLMACVSFACLLAPQREWWMEWIMAFTEAAMIGALADWFAVTALFRRPLGLPIPHTAVIPANKDRIGRDLGEFIKDNFLSEEILRRRLQTIDIGSRLSSWLQDPEISAKLCTRIGGFASQTLHLFDDETVRRFAAENLASISKRVEVAPALGNVLETLLAGSQREELLQSVCTLMERILSDHQELLSAMIRGEIPWWVPGIVHDKIFDQVMAGIHKTLREMNAQPDHKLRRRLLTNLEKLVFALKSDPAYKQQGEKLKEELLRSPFTQRYLAGLGWNIKQSLAQALLNPESKGQKLMREIAATLASALGKTPDVQTAINSWLEKILIDVLMAYRGEIALLIADTIKSWDSGTIVHKIESQVGKDLQYIRINGTLVGGAIGLFIHFVYTLIR